MNKKINISIVGTGLMGIQHIKAISKSKKANLHSIVDISNNAKNLSKKYKIPLYSNLNELLNSKNLDYKKKLFPYQGICLETQYFPDAPNKKNFPSTLIKANKRYTCLTKIRIN